MKPKISVVIATYNRAEILKLALNSFINQTSSKDDYEVIVVDNNSQDNTEEIVKTYIDKAKFNLKYVFEEKAGASIARNSGCRIAEGLYLAFLDDDAFVEISYIEELLNSFDKSKLSPSVVGGRIVPYYLKKKPDWFSDKLEIREKGTVSRLLEGKELEYGFSGSCFAVNRKVFLECGAFNENIGPMGKKMNFGEDTEVFTRILKIDKVFYYNYNLKINHCVYPEKFSKKYWYKRAYRSGIDSEFILSRNEKLLRYIKFFMGDLLLSLIKFRDQKKSFMYLRSTFNYYGRIVGRIKKNYGKNICNNNNVQ